MEISILDEKLQGTHTQKASREIRETTGAYRHFFKEEESQRLQRQDDSLFFRVGL
jgi:hypothetical protein